MKLKPVILFFILLSNISIAQYLKGHYISDKYYFNFNETYAEFAVASECIEDIVYKACGKYELIEGFLIIHTEEYCKEKTHLDKIYTNSDTSIIKILNLDNDQQAVNLSTVTFTDTSENIIYCCVSDNNGVVSMLDISGIQSFYISSPGYQQIKIEFEAGANYIITMVKGEIIEHETLAFHIKLAGDHAFELFFSAVSV